MKIVNKSSRAVIYDSTMLVPMIPCEVRESSEDLKKLYPDLKAMFDNDTLEILSEEQAQAAITELNKQTVEQLKAYAAEQNIDITGLAKKDEIIAAIEAAKA